MISGPFCIVISEGQRLNALVAITLVLYVLAPLEDSTNQDVGMLNNQLVIVNDGLFIKHNDSDGKLTINQPKHSFLYMKFSFGRSIPGF